MKSTELIEVLQAIEDQYAKDPYGLEIEMDQVILTPLRSIWFSKEHNVVTLSSGQVNRTAAQSTLVWPL